MHSRDGLREAQEALKCDDNALREVQRLIIGLNPRPARVLDGRTALRRFGRDRAQGQGDVGRLLNPDAMPKLRINRMYADILSRNRDASHQQLAGQLQEAKWLIKNVQQRFDTILRVSQCIVDRQRHFFEHARCDAPLVLREIAEILGCTNPPSRA